MRWLITLLVAILITACSGASSGKTATAIALLSQTAILTSTATPIPTITPTVTITPAPTTSPTPTLSPTPQGLIGLASCNKVEQLTSIGAGAINTLLYSTDGQWLAAATTSGITLYDAVTLTETWKASTEANLEQIAFSVDGTSLVGVDLGPKIYIWRLDDGKLLLSYALDDLGEPPTVFSLSPDGTILAVPYYDDSIHIYQTSDGSLKNKIEQFLSMGEWIYMMAYSPDGKRFATISFNGDIRIWDLLANKMVSVFPATDDRWPSHLAFTRNGKLLAVNFEDRSGEKTIRMLDIYSLSWRTSLEGEMVSFSPDNSFISLSPDGLNLRDYSYGSILKTLPEQKTIQGQPAFSPDGSYLAVGTVEGIRVWQWKDATLVGSIPNLFTNYQSLAISHDGQFVAGGLVGGVELYQTDDSSMTKFFSTMDSEKPVTEIAYSPLGDLLAGASNSQVYVWKVEDRSLLWSLDEKQAINDLAFSPDGTILAAAISEENLTGLGGIRTSTIPLWNATDGSLFITLSVPDQLLMPGTSSLVFPPDSFNLISAEGNGDLDIWQLTDFTRQYSIESTEVLGWNQVLAISSDGQHFASGGMDRQIRLFKLGEHNPARKINVGDDSISALAYSPDGRLIAAGIATEIRMWETSRGTFLCGLRGSTGVIKEIYFTPDGRNLITLAMDGIIRIWGIP